MAAELIQIVYSSPGSSAEDKTKKCFPFAKIYNNDGKLTPYFESSVILDVLPKSKAKNVAVCSWRLKEKLRWNVPGPVKAREITEELLNTDYEVLSFTRNSHDHEMLAFADRSHPGFLGIFDRILSAIGKTRPREVKTPIYQNHMSVRRDIYLSYLYDYLSPGIHAMENDTELNALAMSDANYSTLAKTDFSWLKEVIGVPYVPFAPFLLERLFSVYCHNEKLNIQQL